MPIYFFSHGKTRPSRAELDSAALGGWLLLRVEVDGGDGEAEVEAAGEEPRVEVGSGRRLVHQPQRRLLPEQHQYVPVDSHRRPWAHVRQNLLP